MHIIVGLVLAAFVLWLWLAGHWFGRVLMFLALVPVLGFVTGALTSGTLDHVEPFGAVIGSIAAWIISSVPIYIERHRQRTKAASAAH